MVGPAFAVVATGFVATRWLQPPAAWIATTQRATFDVLIPLMLFGIMVRLDLPDSPPWRLLGAYYLPTALLFLAVALAHARHGRETATLYGFGAAYSNVVLLGIPVSLAAFGEAGAFALFTIVSVNAPLLFTALALGASTPEDGDPLRVLLRRTLGNPILLALLAGATMNLAGLSLPAQLSALMTVVGKATPVLALLVMGAGLASHPLRGSAADATRLTALKLLLHPLLVWTGAWLLGLPVIERNVLVLLAAMPVGINVWLMALRHRRLEAHTAAAVIYSTALALVSLTLLVSALGGGRG